MLFITHIIAGYKNALMSQFGETSPAWTVDNSERDESDEANDSTEIDYARVQDAIDNARRAEDSDSDLSEWDFDSLIDNAYDTTEWSSDGADELRVSLNSFQELRNGLEINRAAVEQAVDGTDDAYVARNIQLGLDDLDNWNEHGLIVIANQMRKVNDLVDSWTIDEWNAEHLNNLMTRYSSVIRRINEESGWGWDGIGSNPGGDDSWDD